MTTDRITIEDMPLGTKVGFTGRSMSMTREDALDLFQQLSVALSVASVATDHSGDSLTLLIARAMSWSSQTFGPGPRTKGVIEHIRKELNEVEADPGDINEWCDIIILGLDGAWRNSGLTAIEIAQALVAKYQKNFSREWPDWRTASPDHAIEHVKGVND